MQLMDFIITFFFAFIINVENKPWVELDISGINIQRDYKMKHLYKSISGGDKGTIQVSLKYFCDFGPYWSLF